MQLVKLNREFGRLQNTHGNGGLHAICGAGRTVRPGSMFIFMNPTARNVSAHPQWKGIRAPWLGTKTVWYLFYKTGLLSSDLYEATQRMAPTEWTARFATTVYRELSGNGAYVTNLAKCTQSDARPLSMRTFRAYRALMLQEIAMVHPVRIIVFGNQASSVLLDKPVSVSSYSGIESEDLIVSNHVFKVYPVYYPVGQGRRNMPLALERIENILAHE